MSDAGLKDPRKWLRRQAEVIGSIGVLFGATSAVVLFFGGSIPPWYTTAEAQEAERKSSQIQAQTVDTLNRINNKLDHLEHRVDQGECEKLRITLEQASVALTPHPADQIARALRDGTVSRMRDIQGCAP